MKSVTLRRPALREELRRYLLAFLLGFGSLLVVILPIIIADGGYYIYYGDYNSQQIPFYNLANDAVRSGSFGWNWYTDLGVNFIGSYAFYLLGSPFFWLTTLLPRSWVTFAMPVLLCMKHGIASLTAYAYIRRFVRSPHAAMIGGLLYAFSGFQLFNIFFNHFQDVTAFFPLLLIAMEELVNQNRRGVFALSVALLAAINYFFFTGQVVFLVLYFIVRCFSKDFHASLKSFPRSAGGSHWRTIACVISAVGSGNSGKQSGFRASVRHGHGGLQRPHPYLANPVEPVPDSRRAGSPEPVFLRLRKMGFHRRIPAHVLHGRRTGIPQAA
ncbi:MAG: YfhO family protein [Ruminococcus callidus]